MKVKRSDVAALVKVTFPDYRGRKFRVEATEKLTLYDLNWSGGTCNKYRACTIDGQPLGTADKFNQAAPWNNPAEGHVVALVEGCAVVEHSHFQGKDAGITVYVHPANMPKLLEA